MTLAVVVHSAAFRGAISGIIAAATVDLHAFLQWKSFYDVTQYSWSTAAFRWLQGAVTGAIGGAGYGALIN